MGTPVRLVCSRCTNQFDPETLLNLCTCGSPLLVEYDLEKIRKTWSRDGLASSKLMSMWRYAPVLPAEPETAISLQEGWTPNIKANRLGPAIGLEQLWIKDEGRNPTDSFKARGLSCAVTMAAKLGAKKLAIPSAGNAAGALAAYAAKAGLEAFIFMPQDVPRANFLECKAYGANVFLIDGLISDCGRIVGERKQREGWFEVSTLKEPYRIEGKKTMGYEVAEQFGWTLPDAIFYPCGGGVGLIGMWKAFAEMEQLGWIGSKRPKMIAVQATGCQPIVKAFEDGLEAGGFWPDAHTVAAGLRVPKALGDFLVLRAVRESGGVAIAISDEEMMNGAVEMAKTEGILAAPEGGACVIAARQLLQSGFLKPDDRVVLFNTGSGLKYSEAFAARFPRTLESQADKLGGLITPR